MTGIWRSMTTTCGSAARTVSTARAPSSASATTFRSGVREKKRLRTARTEGESSTRTTRITAHLAARPAAAEPYASSSPAQPPHEVDELSGVQALLGEIGVGAGLETLQAVLGAVAGRDDDDRELREVLHAAEMRGELEAVHPRHLDVG